LLEAKGAYYDLYNSQFNNAPEELDEAAVPVPAGAVPAAAGD
jgi:hypothetical protein